MAQLSVRGACGFVLVANPDITQIWSNYWQLAVARPGFGWNVIPLRSGRKGRKSVF